MKPHVAAKRCSEVGQAQGCVCPISVKNTAKNALLSENMLKDALRCTVIPNTFLTFAACRG